MESLLKQVIKQENAKISANRPEPLDLSAVAQHFGKMAANAAKRHGAASFDIDEENTEAINALLLYFANSPKFEKLESIHRPSLNKGIALFGNVGSGKSLLMEVFSLCRYPNRHYSIISARKLVDMYDREGPAGIRTYGQRASKIPECGGQRININTCIDDIGTETLGKWYGKTENVIENIMLDRYDHFVKHGVITHLTTNCTPDQLRQDYTNRVYSRIMQMCNVIYLGENTNSKDRRL